MQFKATVNPKEKKEIIIKKEGDILDLIKTRQFLLRSKISISFEG